MNVVSGESGPAATPKAAGSSIVRAAPAPKAESSIGRLAGLVGMLDDNRRHCTHMRQLLAALERGGMVAVAGELEVLKDSRTGSRKLWP